VVGNLPQFASNEYRCNDYASLIKAARESKGRRNVNDKIQSTSTDVKRDKSHYVKQPPSLLV